MLSFIIVLLLGLGIAFFAGQNTQTVTIALGNYTLPQAPLYVIIVGSLLVGFIISWVVSLVDGLFTTFVIHRKDNVIKVSQKEVARLEQKTHGLEMEIS